MTLIGKIDQSEAPPRNYRPVILATQELTRGFLEAMVVDSWIK